MPQFSNFVDDENENLSLDIENLDDMELHLLAEKVWELLKRDMLLDRERQGLTEHWGGWRQS